MIVGIEAEALPRAGDSSARELAVSRTAAIRDPGAALGLARHDPIVLVVGLGACTQHLSDEPHHDEDD